MGTRSLVRFFDGATEIVCVYQQFDGYLSGVGASLSKFLSSGVMVNGIRVGDDQKVFNGVGCLAAQYVAKHKDGAGGLYLYAPGSSDVGEEYVYEVSGHLADPLMVKVTEYGQERFFGTVKEFAEFLATADSEEA